MTIDNRVASPYVLLIGRTGRNLGVDKKLRGLQRALSASGHSTRLVILDSLGLDGLRNMAGILWMSKEQVVIVRVDLGLSLLLPALLRARLRGAWVCLEVPTPATTAWREIDQEMRSLRQRLSARAFVLLAAPFGRWIANRVIQYAPESRFFAFGQQRRTRKIGNSVSVDDFPLASPPSDGPIVFVAVAALRHVHGIDRLLAGMEAYSDSGGRQIAKLVVIGPVGEEVTSHLAPWMIRASLAATVQFVGPKSGAELDDALVGADIAVGVLGLHRVGLAEASPLKHREYAARGLPVLYAGSDPDIDGQPWTLRIPSDDSPVPVAELIQQALSWREQPGLNASIRAFARENLDFSGRVSNYLP